MNSYRYSDLYVGLEENFNVDIDETKVQRFLDLSGDTNPLHVDASYAISQGFEDRVVYGMLTSSYYSTLIGVYLPGKRAILHSVDIKFSLPVYIGDSLKVCGRIAYLNDAYKQVEIKAFMSNQSGKKVSKAVIKSGVVDE